MLRSWPGFCVLPSRVLDIRNRLQLIAKSRRANIFLVRLLPGGSGDTNRNKVRGISSATRLAFVVVGFVCSVSLNFTVSVLRKVCSMLYYDVRHV